jgi:AcrR family transcriptional regulator
MNLPAATLEPRKKPVQARSEATVDAIFEAAIQVLTATGVERLSTTRVAERAGVSVGSLYQYYPNKHALLAAVLQRHLNEVADAIEQVCARLLCRPLAEVAPALVDCYIDVKLVRADVSKALYALAEQHDGAGIIEAMCVRIEHAIRTALANCADARFEDLDTVVLMVRRAMAGPMQAVLEAGVPPELERSIRSHLTLLVGAYLQGVAAPR